MSDYKIPSRYNWVFNNGDYSDLLIDNKKALIKKYFNEGLRKILEIFDYKKIPNTISHRTLELFILQGYAKIFKKGGKWYCGTGAFSGVFNYDYIPTNATITNTYLRYAETLIVANRDNKDEINESNIEKYVFIVKNDYLYNGLYDELSLYAEMQSECLLTLKALLYNARIPTISVSNSSETTESFKKMYEDIKNGNTGMSLTGNYMFESLKTYPTQTTTTNQIKDVIECMQYNKATFENNIGLNANYNMKRETLSKDEISLNDDNLLPQIDEMLECRKSDFDLINEVANEIVFDVDFKSSWKIKHDEIEIELKTKENESKEIEQSNKNDESEEPKNEVNENDV